MGKIIIIFTIFLTFLPAKSFILSPLPLPQTQVLDIDIDECDKECLYFLLEEGKVFSFLSKMKKVEDKELMENYNHLASLLNIPSFLSEELKIALLLPTKKIGKYAKSSIKSTISYLLSKNINFYLKCFNIDDEEYLTIEDSLSSIKNEDFDFIIAPLTIKGANNIALIPTFLTIYIPTVNKDDIDYIQNSNIIFGGIDYKEQIRTLLNFANEKIVVFYEKESPLAQKLTSFIKDEANFSYIKDIPIKDDVSNLKRFFYKNKDLNSSTIFLNTSIVKSSLIVSQLTLYDLKPPQILSTQINYNPLIFNLTQLSDRENLIIANSIDRSFGYIEEINSLLNNDIRYNWINYSVTIGIDYYYSQRSKENRLFNEEIIDNQVKYNIFLEKALLGEFVKIKNIFETTQETPWE